MKKILFFLLFFFSGPAFAAEEILNYDTEITVQTDASVIVRERITVTREGVNIKRGIYRSLPRTKGVEYDVLSVRRDDRPEAYFTESTGRDFIINTGTDRLLPRNGVYTFEITYRASNVILGFDDYDELYWNVTGDKWAFPIRSATARVILPDNAPARQYSAYTGKHGSKEKGIFSNGLFSAGKPLNPGEGLTVAVGFDKGIVNIPVLPFYDKVPLSQAFRFSSIIFLAYLFGTWFLFGRDPEKETVMPRFNGLPDLTPAQAGWVYSYGKDKDGCLAAALIQGGLAGFLKIREKDGFHITRLRDGKNGEEKFFEHNLSFPLTISKTYTPKMEAFLTAFQEFLKNKTGEKYFASNRVFTIGALLLLMGLTAYQCYLIGALPLAGIMAFYLIFLIPAGREITKMIATGVFRFSPFFILFFICLHFSLFNLSMAASSPEILQICLFYAAGCLAVLIYSHLIIRPTREGMSVIAHVDGIKMFLKAIDTGLPAEVNFDKMEKLLPYAVLLGLEKEWGEKMRQIADSMNYRPEWYSGNTFSAARFAGLRSTVAAACARPSRSGSGGGGFSGGGFGGGGGGGR